MHASNLIAAIALAGAASSAALPQQGGAVQPKTHCPNPAHCGGDGSPDSSNKFGTWTLTSIHGSLSPSNTFLTFNLKDTNTVRDVKCSATLSDRVIGPENAYFPCDDDTVQFTTSRDLDQIYIARTIFQTKSFVKLNGTTLLPLEYKQTNSGKTFTSHDLTVTQYQTN